MHYWGDEGVDWEGINSAASYIGLFCRKWGRISVTQYKEKYGTVRVYCSFRWVSLHSLTHPGYVYSQYPQWLWSADIRYIGPFFRKSGLSFLIWQWQKFIYRLAYKNALKKWPHLRKEILSCADFDELLEGL